jgi:hypothetical protein
MAGTPVAGLRWVSTACTAGALAIWHWLTLRSLDEPVPDSDATSNRRAVRVDTDGRQPGRRTPMVPAVHTDCSGDLFDLPEELKPMVS